MVTQQHEVTLLTQATEHGPGDQADTEGEYSWLSLHNRLCVQAHQLSVVQAEAKGHVFYYMYYLLHVFTKLRIFQFIFCKMPQKKNNISSFITCREN